MAQAVFVNLTAHPPPMPMGSSSDAGDSSSSAHARSHKSTSESAMGPRTVVETHATTVAANVSDATAKSKFKTTGFTRATTTARSITDALSILMILAILALFLAIGLYLFGVAYAKGLDANDAAEYLAKLRATADEHAAGCGTGIGTSRTAAFLIEPENAGARGRRQINVAAYLSKRATVPWYTCDSTTCKLPNCQCAQNRPPAGLDLSQVPQFITITFDDAVNAVTYAPTVQLLQGITNPDGCGAKATYFVSAQYTDWHAVQTLYAAGHEIADHTFSHVAPSTKDEISSLVETLSALAMIPRSAIQGFRAPFLKITTTTLDTLRTLNFSYDSSIGVTPVAGKTLWPFTLDAGLPVTCKVGDCSEAISKPDGTHSNWSAPGIWELPMYTLVAPDGNDFAIMDPPLSGANLMDVLERNFDLHYSGSRAPFGLYLHAGWLLGDPTRSDTVRAFLDKVRQRGNVYVVSNVQMLAWLRNPRPVSSTGAGLPCPGSTAARGPEVCDGLDNDGNGAADDGVMRTCRYPTAVFGTCAAGCPVRAPSVTEPVPPLTDPGTKCVEPMGTCVNGDWDATKCLCKCNGTVDGAGWCRDLLGSCSIAKRLVNGRYARCAYDPATSGKSAGKVNKDSATGNAAARVVDAMHGAMVAVFVAIVAVILSVVVGSL
ncbi:hypothetical protein AMAG_16782 [Allomyces macrogynus ATCC 38327]|uniref:NodB homology domain-containing protein n=1 Tax=Allomyces macrogynus (strain ATCC 38327) TaxID=578462 RepID=A0A0L0TC12_ALLM3|nr:hypothetical protein AMAG_16782 [Allomyces macrogynus ATCC 38327]|eukprot:KNE72292.1 hypothetical protein AMAG_16782 [Allomyces macrogynus ATCC 38327]